MRKRKPAATVAIGIPAGDDVKTDFALSLTRMVNWTWRYNQEHRPIAFSINCWRQSLIPLARYRLVEAAIQQQATHLLMIDSDMDFPGDMMIRMIKRNVDILGVNATTRRPPFIKVGTEVSPRRWLTPSEALERSGIESVYRIGFGAVLFKMRVFETVSEPWFDTEWRRIQGELVYIGEDYYFIDKCRDHGFEIHVDHDIEIGHVGSFNYNLKSIPNNV